MDAAAIIKQEYEYLEPKWTYVFFGKQVKHQQRFRMVRQNAQPDLGAFRLFCGFCRKEPPTDSGARILKIFSGSRNFVFYKRNQKRNEQKTLLVLMRNVVLKVGSQTLFKMEQNA